jgi:hypothetical protein
MTAIPEALELRLKAHETKRDDAAGAREALEEAVLLQVREIADGLLADILLRGGPVDGRAWWCQFLSRQEHPARYLPDLQDNEFRAYRQDFAQSIAVNRIARVGLDGLADVQVRVLGGRCRFADEGRLNGQLARLGSSLRLVLVGGSRQRMARMRSLLDQKPDAGEPLDGRFILGRVGPISYFCGASLYLFEREFAVSPYMEAGASGFSDETRIVVRQDVLRGGVEEKLRERGSDGSHDAEELLRMDIAAVLVHEAVHSRHQGAQVSPGTGPLTVWRNAAREDLLRFAQIPHTLEEFRTVFAESFGEKGTKMNIMMGDMFDIRRPGEGFTVERELEALRSERLLFVDREDRYFSTIYGRGQPWTL